MELRFVLGVCRGGRSTLLHEDPDDDVHQADGDEHDVRQEYLGGTYRRNRPREVGGINVNPACIPFLSIYH